jgi:hypothetical protein
MNPIQRSIYTESLRYWSLRGNRVLVVTVVVAAALISSLTAASSLVTDSDTSAEAWSLLATQGATMGAPPLCGYLIGLTGILAWSEEVSGEASMVTPLGVPRRWKAFVARNLSVVAVAVMLATATCLISIACGLAFTDLDLSSPVGRLLVVKWLRLSTFCALLSLIAGATTILVRSAVIAAFVLLLLPWVVEPLIVQIVVIVPALGSLIPCLSYLPFAALGDVLAVPAFDGFVLGRTNLAQGAAVGVAGSATALLLVAANVTYGRSSLPTASR